MSGWLSGNVAKTEAELVNPREEAVKKLIAQFNKPHQCAVAVNTLHIGDDNDYSCWLSSVVYALYTSGHEQKAFELFQTDPMNYEPSKENFDAAMERREQSIIEEKEREEYYNRYYKD